MGIACDEMWFGFHESIEEKRDQHHKVVGTPKNGMIAKSSSDALRT